MSTLVAYENSSDEEDVAEADPDPDSSTTIEALHSSTILPDGSTPAARAEVVAPHNGISEASKNRPLLGPIAPTNGGIVHVDALVEISGNVSERDIIRQLTQASIPMASMPPSPPGSPDHAINARFNRFLELKAQGVHFNEDLAKKSSFLNPGLMATMMARAGVDKDDQYNTSLLLELWNPKSFPAWAYKEELLRSQQETKDRDDTEKSILSTTGKRMIDFAPSGSGGTSGDSSRKSTPGYQKKRRRP